MEPREIQFLQGDSAAHKEVGGWLLVLCLVLTFVYPATSFYDIGAHVMPRLIAEFQPGRVLLLSVYSVFFSYLAILSLIAGGRLWIIKPGAVRSANRFLLTYLIGNIAYFAFWTLLTRPSQLLSVAEMGWHHVVGPIGSFALWYLYLEHSKRVRATYLR